MARRSVLVTGMSGLIGGALRRHLEGTYTLSALNRRPLPGVRCHQADIADLDAIAPAFDGVDTVVHLAARTGESESFDEILRANVIGTYNVFEAARRLEDVVGADDVGAEDLVERLALAGSRGEVDDGVHAVERRGDRVEVSDVGLMAPHAGQRPPVQRGERVRAL